MMMVSNTTETQKYEDVIISEGKEELVLQQFTTVRCMYSWRVGLYFSQHFLFLFALYWAIVLYILYDCKILKNESSVNATFTLYHSQHNRGTLAFIFGLESHEHLYIKI